MGTLLISKIREVRDPCSSSLDVSFHNDERTVDFFFAYFEICQKCFNSRRIVKLCSSQERNQ